MTAARTSSGWSSTWMRRRSPLGPESVWILASAASMPLSSSTARASSTVWPLASNSQATPPSKSIPRLSPLKISEITLSTMRTPDAMKPMRRLPTKSKFVSPW